MLCEPLGNWKKYDFGPTWEAVMSWLEQNAASLSAPTTVAGCEIRLSEGKTKRLDCCLYETHRKMVDVQIVTRGEEWVYVASSEGLAYIDPFDEEKDCGHHVIPDREIARVTLHPGVFAAVFPWDAHMPMVAVDDIPTKTVKIVAKIPLEKLRLN